MASRVSVGGSARSSDARLPVTRGMDCLSTAGGCPVICNDRDTADRNPFASQESFALWCVQTLATIDTASLAKDPEQLTARLAQKFHSISSALNVDPERCDLNDDEREFVKALSFAKRIVGAAFLQDARSRPLDTRSASFTQYLKLELALQTEERLLMIMLDCQGRVIRSTHVADGGLSSVSAPMRVMARKALDTGAHQVILAHNHPSGSVWPSQGDKAMTERFGKAFEALEIQLIDHLIVTKDAIASTRTGTCW